MSTLISYSLLNLQFAYMTFICSQSLLYHFTGEVINLTKIISTPSWFVSSVSTALHWYHRCHGFKSRTDLNVFSGLIFTTA